VDGDVFGVGEVVGTTGNSENTFIPLSLSCQTGSITVNSTSDNVNIRIVTTGPR
jgi:hypothetical protein